MTSSVQAITFDCADAVRLSAFWAGVFGTAVDPDEAGSGVHFQSIGRSGAGSATTMMFIQVPEAKTAKNRMHLDLATDDVAAEVARLVELGARVLHEKDEWGVQWTTLADPEGNEFCVSTAH